MTDWPLVHLGEYLRIKHGLAFQGKYFSDRGHYIVLTPGNFIESGGFKPKFGAEKYYSATPPSEFVLRRGDLVIAMTEQAQGLLGSSALIPIDDTYLHNQRIGLVEQRSGDTDLQFLYYLFNTSVVRAQIQATATGAKVRHTAPARIENVSVFLPPLTTQRKIAAILSAYDDHIENNTRRIKILEEMAQRTYREWFVDFRYPGLDISALVSGSVPTGWDVGRLGDHIEVIRGRSYRGSEVIDEGGVPFINLKCIEREGGFRDDGLKRYGGDFKAGQKISTGDIIVAVTDMTQERRIVARAARVPDLQEEFGVFSMDLVKVEPRDLPREFLLAVLQYSNFPDRVKAHANGANVLHLHPDRISEFVTTFPPSAIAKRYADVVRPMVSLADNLRHASYRARKARDLLLPRLVTGEIDLSEREIATPPTAA